MEHADLLLFEGMRRGALATSNVARGRHVRRLQIGNNRSSGKASEFLGVCAVCQQGGRRAWGKTFGEKRIDSFIQSVVFLYRR